jgi:IS4 transposase
MASPNNLEHWLQDFLPDAGRCAQEAGAALVRALLLGFTAVLGQLARQSERQTAVKGRRQRWARWLARPHWEPETLYAALTRRTRRFLVKRREDMVIVFDFTDLGTTWRVLQVSLAWQGRAVALYRIVCHHANPELGQKEQVRRACAFLRAHLPGPLSRYVLVMDRGFPSHLLVRELTEAHWRFVLRISGEWKLTHREYTGRLKSACQQPGLVGPDPRCFREAVLGCRGRGRAAWSCAQVVTYWGERAKAPWYLVTSERQALRAVQLYRQRWQIECEFRDLKGPVGLDRLANWQDREEVARFLALVAVYEWRLVHLWLKHRLAAWTTYFQFKGRLSWFQITRHWIQHQLRLPTYLTLARL